LRAQFAWQVAPAGTNSHTSGGATPPKKAPRRGQSAGRPAAKMPRPSAAGAYRFLRVLCKTSRAARKDYMEREQARKRSLEIRRRRNTWNHVSAGKTRVRASGAARVAVTDGTHAGAEDARAADRCQLTDMWNERPKVARWQARRVRGHDWIGDVPSKRPRVRRGALFWHNACLQLKSASSRFSPVRSGLRGVRSSRSAIDRNPV
jgi:hypothetical protein